MKISILCSEELKTCCDITVVWCCHYWFLLLCICWPEQPDPSCCCCCLVLLRHMSVDPFQCMTVKAVRHTVVGKNVSRLGLWISRGISHSCISPTEAFVFVFVMDENAEHDGHTVCREYWMTCKIWLLFNEIEKLKQQQPLFSRYDMLRAAIQQTWANSFWLKS